MVERTSEKDQPPQQAKDRLDQPPKVDPALEQNDKRQNKDTRDELRHKH